jgi:hypothetical protein
MSDSDEPKKKRKPRRKRIGRAPKHMVILKNKDKSCHETRRERDSVLRFIHPFRCCILGQVNSGKSLIMKNILMAQQGRNPKFQQLIVINPNLGTREYEDLDPTELRNTIPDMNELDPSIKKLIVIDDFEFHLLSKEQTRRISELFRYGSSHINTSIILCHQNFFRIPKSCKDNSNVFIIFRPNDTDELKTIARRVGMDGMKMINLFKTILPNFRDSLTINLIPDWPHRYYKNLFEAIAGIESDSE